MGSPAVPGGPCVALSTGDLVEHALEARPPVGARALPLELLDLRWLQIFAAFEMKVYQLGIKEQNM